MLGNPFKILLVAFGEHSFGGGFRTDVNKTAIGNMSNTSNINDSLFHCNTVMNVGVSIPKLKIYKILELQLFNNRH